MRVLGIIPARYASTRLPGKPLFKIFDKSMIQRVYEQAVKANSLDMVVVATDDVSIKSHVENFGGNVMMTSIRHESGTSRCSEVGKVFTDYDVIVNIQGDEPFINPSQINALVSTFSQDNVEIATLAIKIMDDWVLHNPNNPKVIINVNGDAIYFSRAPIPYLRGVPQNQWVQTYDFYKHIGLYAYKRETLLKISGLGTSILEDSEKLEQLNWIENGYKIKVIFTDEETLSIDSIDDLNKANLWAKSKNL